MEDFNTSSVASLLHELLSEMPREPQEMTKESLDYWNCTSAGLFNAQQPPDGLVTCPYHCMFTTGRYRNEDIVILYSAKTDTYNLGTDFWDSSEFASFLRDGVLVPTDLDGTYEYLNDEQKCVVRRMYDSVMDVMDEQVSYEDWMAELTDDEKMLFTFCFLMFCLTRLSIDPRVDAFFDEFSKRDSIPYILDVAHALIGENMNPKLENSQATRVNLKPNALIPSSLLIMANGFEDYVSRRHLFDDAHSEYSFSL